MAYGESDEYSFGFCRSSHLYNRRKEKILSSVVSYFSSAYVYYWTKYFPDTVLKAIPVFDGRIVLYPDIKSFKDYFAWRQADTHINNLYNTTFWCLVKAGMSKEKAHQRLKGSESKDKNEILFSEFKINYNDLPEVYKKGTIIIRVSNKTKFKERRKKTKANPITEITTKEEDKSTENIDNKEVIQTEEVKSNASSKQTAEAKEDIQKKQLIKIHESVFSQEFWTKHNLEDKLN
eukprot:TRINITY_DN11804_c0_g1_i1.p1 TRINITY_DN11804_c0_g1~~TRINITY_DN11804_c0_g1_i1.p1  ORF type:complete len:234 (-),score=56.07 TRINITY_DN11804_c0_g1_i1:45-746(-)